MCRIASKYLVTQSKSLAYHTSQSVEVFLSIKIWLSTLQPSASLYCFLLKRGRGFFGMYDFYTELNLFWENYGKKSDTLDWLGELQKNLKQIFFIFRLFSYLGNCYFVTCREFYPTLTAMYSTYSSDKEFQKMFAMKKREKQLLFPGSLTPDQDTVKKMIIYLNKNPREVSKIMALKEVSIRQAVLIFYQNFSRF